MRRLRSQVKRLRHQVDQVNHVAREAKEGVSPSNTGSVTDWTDVTGKPSTFPPEAHTHVSADITDLVTPSLAWTSVVLSVGSTNCFEKIQTVVDALCAPSSTVELKLEATVDTDENEPEFLDIASLTARPASGSFSLTAVFAQPTTGPIKMQYRIS